MKYAKLKNGLPLYAPRCLVQGERVVYNPPDEMYEAAGYLEVVRAEQPQAEPGWHYEPSWAEAEGKIVQSWTLVEDADDVPPADALEILFGGEGA